MDTSDKVVLAGISVVVFIILAAIGLAAYDDKLVAHLVSTGADPLVARCSITPASSVCHYIAGASK